jgi:FAD:protein FMN transferase
LTESTVFHDGFYSMGTRFDIVIPEIKNEIAGAVFEQIKSELTRIEKLLSSHNQDNIIEKINNAVNVIDLNIGEELYNMITSCKKYYQLTGGYFDITIAPLLKLWKVEKGKSSATSAPAKEKIDILMQLVGMDKAILKEKPFSISFKKPQMAFEFGGFGKGYALEKVNDILHENKIENALVNFGDSTIMARGRHPYGNCWKIGIVHKEDPNQTLFTFDAKDATVSTSGSVYSNIGSNQGHVLNPLTGIPVSANHAVSVMAKNALDAEVLSTAMLAAGFDYMKNMHEKFSGINSIFVEYLDNGAFNLFEI